jgi:hypothetical protein
MQQALEIEEKHIIRISQFRTSFRNCKKGVRGKPERAYFTHISHHLGLHEHQVEKELPENVLLMSLIVQHMMVCL